MAFLLVIHPALHYTLENILKTSNNRTDQLISPHCNNSREVESRRMVDGASSVCQPSGDEGGYQWIGPG